MATYTSYLNLKKPEGGERYALADFNANMQKIDDFATAINGKVARTTSINVTGVTGSNNAGFITNLMQALARRYDFSTLVIGDVIAGRAEWSGVDYVHYTVTKMTGSAWNVFVNSPSRIVTGYYNTSNGTLTGVNDVISQKASYESGAWTPKLYDYETYKRDLTSQVYFKIGKFYAMFIYQSNVDYSGITTMVQYRNLPCAACIGGTVYLQGRKSTIAKDVGAYIQGSGTKAYVRENIISTDFANPTSSGITNVVLFGYDY